MNERIFEKILCDNIPNIVADLKPDFDSIILHKNNGDREISKVIYLSVEAKQVANESALILINAIGMLLPTCCY
jgi:hypothetical protein